LKIEMHCHTKEVSPCADVPAERVIEELIKKGFDGVLITDHESIDGWRKVSKKKYENFVILRGFEFLTVMGDMLVILPEEEVIPYKEDIYPLDLIDIVHKKNGAVGIPHMFRKSVFLDDTEKYKDLNYFPTISIGISSKDFFLTESIIKAVDFVEVENGRATENENYTAEWWANQYFKTKTKGSDSHTLDEIGKCYTEILMEIKNEADLIFALKNNLVR